MTLTELLAAIVILGMIGTVLGGGVMMVKNVYQRTQEQADAEQALSLTAQLMTDEFANALEVKNSAGTSATGELVTPLLRSGNGHLWLHFSATDWSGTGIEKWYGDYTYDDAYNKISLLTQAAISEMRILYGHLTAGCLVAAGIIGWAGWRSTGKKIRWELPGKRW